MITRRAVLGAGVGFAAVSSTASFAVYDFGTRRPPEPRSIDALLIDQTIEMPGPLAAFIDARLAALPLVEVRLDAAAHAGLMHVLDKSRHIVGISCGATLFCLERLAWNHGFRLGGRNQVCGSGVALRQSVEAFINAQRSSAARTSNMARQYRPSRADGILHAWTMQKSARTQLIPDRAEIWP